MTSGPTRGKRRKSCCIAVETFHLSLPLSLVLELKNCYYVSTISRNIISIPCLNLEGFQFSIKKCIVLLIVMIFFIVAAY